MAMSTRRAQPHDLESLAELAVDAQSDPERFCAYLADDATAIATDVAGVAGPDAGDWTTATWMAIDGDEQLLGRLLAETDPEMKRVWWWGPTLTDTSVLSGDDSSDAVDRLFAAALDTLDDYSEHEMAIDDRSIILAEAARRQGFSADPASVVMTAEPSATATWEGDDDVIALTPDHYSSVIALHDELFADTHTTGAKLVEADENHARLVLVDVDSPDPSHQRVIGYVATEAHSDGSLYIDYLGVVPEYRGRGFGRRLVLAAMGCGVAAGSSHTHLTVRAENTAARRLYASLGFVDERVIVPYRRGFSLE